MRLAVAAVLQPARIARERRIGALVVAGDEELDEVVDVARAHVGKAGHAAGALADDAPRSRRACGASPMSTSDGAGRRALAILAVAGRALAVVERRVVVRDQLDDPRHLVRVDVEQRALGIERRAAPFGAAVDAGKDDRALERRRREEARFEYLRNCASTAACASGVRVVSMSSVSPCRANGGGLTGYGCVLGELLAVDRRRAAPCAISIGKQRRAGLADRARRRSRAS